MSHSSKAGLSLEVPESRNGTHRQGAPSSRLLPGTAWLGSIMAGRYLTLSESGAVLERGATGKD